MAKVFDQPSFDMRPFVRWSHSTLSPSFGATFTRLDEEISGDDSGAEEDDAASGDEFCFARTSLPPYRYRASSIRLPVGMA